MHSPGRLKMACKHWSLLATIGVAALLCSTSPALAQARLGTAASFAILAGTPKVENTGPSVVIGNLGIDPAIAVIGFPPGLVIGAIHTADGVSLQAKNDLTTAYTVLAGEPCPTSPAPSHALGPNLTGLTLPPGVYCFTTEAMLPVGGTLTLDAQGDPNAEFIFQVGSALTMNSDSTVRMINGGSFCNVFWQVGSDATIGTNSDFVGNIVALTSIVLKTGANVFGRVLARNGAVTLDTNHISNGGCAGGVPLATPTIAKEFSPATISENPGDFSTLTITLSNANTSPATGAAFTDTLPTGVVIATLPNSSTTCGVGSTLTANAGTSTVTLTGGTIPGGSSTTPGVCTVTVDVTATAGSHLNTLPVGALTTSNGDNATEASATLTVPAPGEVTIGKAFSPASITAGGDSTLTITLSNANANDATDAAFTDTLPTGVVIATPPNASTTCGVGSTLTANAGTSTVTLTGGTIPGGTPFGTCTVTVDVTAGATGSYPNTLPAGALTTSNFGHNAAPATATLTVSPAVILSLCLEDLHRAALLTKTVNLSLPNLSGSGVPGDPKNYWLVQAAYDAAKGSAQAEVIGLFANTNENLLLDGAKSLTITQCTVARVTGAAGSPVWNITSTGKLTISGADSVGGSIGWRVAGNGGHNLKSIRANGATKYGVQIVSSSNSVSWNDVSGNGTAISDAGIRVEGSSNTLKGGTVGSNKGDGVQLIGNSNTLSGSNIVSNTGNGVLVTGSTNKVDSNGRINLNKLNGILVTGSSNTLSSNASESGKGNTQNGIKVASGSGNQLTGNKMNSNAQAGFYIAASPGTKLKSNATSNNTGNEYTIGAGNVDQGGNKKNGSSFTFTSAGGIFN
jgi:uncharacterized repeat protein (TIGR01451 family)